MLVSTFVSAIYAVQYRLHHKVDCIAKRSQFYAIYIYIYIHVYMYMYMS